MSFTWLQSYNDELNIGEVFESDVLNKDESRQLLSDQAFDTFQDVSSLTQIPSWTSNTGAENNKSVWSSEEDSKLTALVAEFGPKNWPALANDIPGHTGDQCRERWVNDLKPKLGQSVWSADEEAFLLRLYRQFGNRWSEIAKYFPGRTENSIRDHWSSSVKQKWCGNNQNDTSFSAAPTPGTPVPYTPSQNSGLDGILPVRLFDTPKTLSTKLKDSGISVKFESSSPGVHESLFESVPPLIKRSRLVMTPTSQNSLLLEDFSPGSLSLLSEVNVDDVTLNDLSAIYDLLCETPKIPTPAKPASVKKRRSLDFQLGDKSFASLQLCTSSTTPIKEEAKVIMAPPLSSVKRKSTGVRVTSTPCILRRRRKRQNSVMQRPNSTPLRCSDAAVAPPPVAPPPVVPPPIFVLKAPEMISVVNTCVTPKKVPDGPFLPFSPSQFLNLDGPGVLTSTPVECKSEDGIANSVPTDKTQTPSLQTTSRMLTFDIFPQTPTPFKDMSADQNHHEASHSYALLSPSSPDSTDDVPVPFESCRSTSLVSGAQLSSGTTVYRLRTQPSVTARNITESVLRTPGTRWTAIGDLALSAALFSPETPSKSLIGEQNIIFSPPSIIRETLHETMENEQPTSCRSSDVLNEAFLEPRCVAKNEPKVSQDWERVACGRTSTQLELIKQARELVGPSRQLRPRCLKL